MRLSLNLLLGLIFQAKRTGRGLLGNGRICVRLLEIIADADPRYSDKERDILSKFGNDVSKPSAYKKLDRFLPRFIKTGKGYPYQIITLSEFENPNNYAIFMAKMSTFCSEILDEKKCENLIYTLLEIMERDTQITLIYYYGQYVPKADFMGNFAHCKRICIEPFLLGLLHYTHKNPVEQSIENLHLYPLPDRTKFTFIHWRNDIEVFNLDAEINVENSLHINSKKSYAIVEIPDDIYPVQLAHDDKNIAELPVDRNVFLYGSGANGKSTYLKNLVKNNDIETVFLYLSLYNFRTILLSENRSWILVHILLKYVYQYEYPDLESCIACEGKDAVLQHLHELERLMKRFGNDFVLLLDGMNEMSPELQEFFVKELENILNEWQNVRIITSGQFAPKHYVFKGFYKCEICGMSENSCISLLSEHDITVTNNKLIEILRSPMFLNMYLSATGEFNSRGELIEAYVNEQVRKMCEKNSINVDRSVIRFVVKYVLPFAAKHMVNNYSFEISRSEIATVFYDTIECYIKNEPVFLNYIAPQKLHKKALFECREKSEIIDFLLDNLCFLETSISQPHLLHFTHQYFRDYFAAHHILNLIEAVRTLSDEEQEDFFNRYELNEVWYPDRADDVYIIIGEITGDYKNIASADMVYTKTILDELLDICRKFDTFRASENIIRVMSLVRNKVICDVDFSNIRLPLSIPSDLKFSLNGEYPCDFRNSSVHFFDILEDYDSTDIGINKELTNDMLSQTDNFKNCDFRNASFFNSEYPDALRKMGAVI